MVANNNKHSQLATDIVAALTRTEQVIGTKPIRSTNPGGNDDLRIREQLKLSREAYFEFRNHPEKIDAMSEKQIKARFAPIFCTKQWKGENGIADYIVGGIDDDRSSKGQLDLERRFRKDLPEAIAELDRPQKHAKQHTGHKGTHGRHNYNDRPSRNSETVINGTQLKEFVDQLSKLQSLPPELRDIKAGTVYDMNKQTLKRLKGVAEDLESGNVADFKAAKSQMEHLVPQLVSQIKDDQAGVSANTAGGNKRGGKSLAGQ